MKDDHQVVLAAWTLGAWAAACEVKQGDYVVQPIHGDSHPRSQSWSVTPKRRPPVAPGPLASRSPRRHLPFRVPNSKMVIRACRLRRGGLGSRPAPRGGGMVFGMLTLRGFICVFVMLIARHGGMPHPELALAKRLQGMQSPLRCSRVAAGHRPGLRHRGEGGGGG